MMKKLILSLVVCCGLAGTVSESVVGMDAVHDYSVSYGGYPIKIERTRWDHLAVKTDQKKQIDSILSLGLDALDTKDHMQNIVAILTELGAACSNYAWMVFVDTYPNNCDERQRRVGNIIANLAQFQSLNMPVRLNLQDWYTEVDS